MKKIYNIIAAAAVSMGMWACTDWDDHYDQADSAAGGTGASIWATIESRSDLSDFAELLKKVGYDQKLSASQSYTVWAPLNGEFNKDELNAKSDSLLEAEFIKNHIARGLFNATGVVDNEAVHLLNGKIKRFNGSGTSYTMGGSELDQLNISVGNGLLHTLKQDMEFEPNLYEYMKSNDQTSEIASFFAKYDQRDIDADKSVAGPTVNGNLTYLDTVYTEYNTMFQRLDAAMDDEDSSYTIVVPTNEAWQKAKTLIESYYKYPAQGFTKFELSFEDGDMEQKLSGNYTTDFDSLKNYYSNYKIARDLTFSHNVYDNAKLQKGTTGLDSIVSTTYGKYKGADASAIFEGALQHRQLSNGQVYLTDSLRHRPWVSWNPVIWVNASSRVEGADVASVSTVRVNSGNINPTFSGSLHGATNYVRVESTGQSNTPRVYFSVSNMLSTSYAVYMMALPSNVTDTVGVCDPLSVRGYYMFYGQGGTAPKSTQRFSDDDIEFNFGTKDASTVKTLYLGEVTAPTTTVGTDDCYNVLDVRVRKAAASRKGELTGYDNNPNIVALILVPMDLINYYYPEGSETREDYKGEMPELIWDLIDD